jgi:TonB family protein
MRTLLILLILSTVTIFQLKVACANTNNKNNYEVDSVGTTSREIFFFVEESPQFPGGNEELKIFFSKNLTFPKSAQEKHIECQVYIRFEIKKDGSIGEVMVSKSVHPLLDAEAIRVIKSMPNWLPGRFRGKPISSWYTLPISFFLKH